MSEIPALLKKNRTLVFFIAGLLLLMLAVSLNGPARSFDFLVIKHAAGFAMAASVLNVVIVLLYARLFHFLMNDIICFSCGLFCFGLSLLVWKIHRLEDRELEEITKGEEGAEFTRGLIKKAPLNSKIAWGLALAAGMAVAVLFDLAGRLDVFFR